MIGITEKLIDERTEDHELMLSVESRKSQLPPPLLNPLRMSHPAVKTIP